MDPFSFSSVLAKFPEVPYRDKAFIKMNGNFALSETRKRESSSFWNNLVSEAISRISYSGMLLSVVCKNDYPLSAVLKIGAFKLCQSQLGDYKIIYKIGFYLIILLRNDCRIEGG